MFNTCCGIGSYEPDLGFLVRQAIDEMNAAMTRDAAGKIMNSKLTEWQEQAEWMEWTDNDLVRAYGEMRDALIAWQPPTTQTVPQDNAAPDFEALPAAPRQLTPRGGAPTVFPTPPAKWYQNPWVLGFTIVAGLVLTGAVVWYFRPVKGMTLGVVSPR